MGDNYVIWMQMYEIIIDVVFKCELKIINLILNSG